VCDEKLAEKAEFPNKISKIPTTPQTFLFALEKQKNEYIPINQSIHC